MHASWWPSRAVRALVDRLGVAGFFRVDGLQELANRFEIDWLDHERPGAAACGVLLACGCRRMQRRPWRLHPASAHSGRTAGPSRPSGGMFRSVRTTEDVRVFVHDLEGVGPPSGQRSSRSGPERMSRRSRWRNMNSTSGSSSTTRSFSGVGLEDNLGASQGIVWQVGVGIQGVGKSPTVILKLLVFSHEFHSRRPCSAT